MASWLRELRERLLRAGVAPRHVRRYLTELREHWADLTAEEERAGLSRSAAEAQALARLGRPDDLARTVIERPELRSWTARAPWAVLSAGPLLGLAAGWAIALLILWTGWTWFLQGVPSPFSHRLHGFSIVYFGVGRMLYYWSPLLAGWSMILLAGRQRMRSVWPVILGSLAVAVLGAMGSVDVRQPTIPGRAGDVGIRFFPPPPELAGHAAVALLLFSLIAIPWLLWRWKSAQVDLGRA